MKLLIDTHVLLWLVDEASVARIPLATAATLRQPENDLLVSAITSWELSLKYWLGKLPEARILLAAWSLVVSRLRMTVVPLTDVHGILAGQLDWDHKDPFDRMIAAQSVLESATLVSADTAFDTAHGVHRLW